MFGHERLDAYQAALTFLGVAGRIIGRLPCGHAYFKGQLGRAALSIVTNIAEGAGRRRRKPLTNDEATSRLTSRSFPLPLLLPLPSDNTTARQEGTQLGKTLVWSQPASLVSLRLLQQFRGTRLATLVAPAGAGAGFPAAEPR